MSENITFRSSFNGFNRMEVMQFISELMNNNEENEMRISELTAKLHEKDRIIEELQNKADSSADCEHCDLAKQNQVKIGAAFLDAKRFSDFIVDEANEKSAKMYETTSADARDAAVKAKELCEKIKSTAGEYTNEFNLLIGKMNDMYKLLADFGNGLIRSKKDIVADVAEEPKQEQEKSDRPSFADGWKAPIGEGVFDPDFNFLDNEDKYTLSFD